MAEATPLKFEGGVISQFGATDTIPENNISKNIDGGSSNSVYLASQNINGGTASG